MCHSQRDDPDWGNVRKHVYSITFWRDRKFANLPLFTRLLRGGGGLGSMYLDCFSFSSVVQQNKMKISKKKQGKKNLRFCLNLHYRSQFTDLNATAIKLISFLQTQVYFLTLI